MSIRRAHAALASMIALAFLIAGCTTEADNDATPDEVAAGSGDIVFDVSADLDIEPMSEHDDAVVTDAVRFDPPEIDSAAMETDLPQGAEIHALDHTYVGRVTDDLFIAVTLDDRYTWQAQDVMVYLCDGIDTAAYLVGEFDPDGTTLTGHVLEVDFTMENGIVSGTVALPDETHDFSASASSSPAGLFVAEYQQDGVDASAWWIVLEDGEQRGTISQLPCIPVPRVGCIPLPQFN